MLLISRLDILLPSHWLWEYVYDTALCDHRRKENPKPTVSKISLKLSYVLYFPQHRTFAQWNHETTKLTLSLRCHMHINFSSPDTSLTATAYVSYVKWEIMLGFLDRDKRLPLWEVCPFVSEFNSIKSFVFHLLSVAAAFAKCHPHFGKTKRNLAPFCSKRGFLKAGFFSGLGFCLFVSLVS